MKSTFKKTLLIVLAAAFAFSLTGCFLQVEVTPKDFKVHDLTITLDSGYKESALEGFTGYFESPKAVVMLLRESFTQFEEAGLSTDYTLQEYAQIIKDGGSIDGDTVTDEENNIVYFCYEKTLNLRNYFYFACVSRTDNAYWLNQFACDVSDKDEYLPVFIEMAKSIKFDSAAA